MKVIVSQFGPGATSDISFPYSVSFIDTSVSPHEIVEEWQDVLLLETEVLAYTEDEIADLIETKILAHAVAQSYIITAVDILWLGIKTTASTYQNSPVNPTGTTSTTGVMMGLAGSFTPIRSGKVMAIISGNMANNTAGNGASAQIRYGTGSAPANAAGLTGTVMGGISQILNDAVALIVLGSGNFTCNAIIDGLGLGTAYWLDVSLASITGGTSTISNVSISIVEL